jgi:hypothetical protein
MIRLLAFSHNTAVTVAEVAFLLLLIAGVWIAVAWILDRVAGELCLDGRPYWTDGE